MDGLDVTSMLIVHQDNARQWQAGIAQWGSKALQSRRLSVVGVRHAMEALPHAVTGLGVHEMHVDLPDLTRF